MEKFWNGYNSIVKELNEVKSIIDQNIVEGQRYLREPLKPVVDKGGKMLRPAFFILSSKFGDYEKDKMYNMAAAIEILHIATLIHDDIIDEAKLRRGSESIQSKYGKDFAVYAGDYLFSQCFLMLSKYKYKEENLKNLPKLISKICIGEMRQYNLRYCVDTNFKNYLKIISAKTAALFAISLSSGAVESNCDERLVKRLGKIGYCIGMAFQIIDDILDFTGDSAVLGKNAQKDLIRGYYTIPLIFAMQNDKGKYIKEILNNTNFNEKDVKKLVELVKLNGGIDKARELAKKYTAKVYSEISRLPECESKHVLQEISRRLLDRDY